MFVADDRNRRWAPLVGGDVATRAREVAKDIAKRLWDREVLLAANRAALGQTHYPRTIYWEPYGIAHGDAGIALVCSYLDACFPSEGWDVVGHNYLTRAVQAANHVGCPPLDLFGGLAGLAFAARSLSRDGTRYRGLLEAINENLSIRALGQACTLVGRHGVAVSEFDLITGLSGVGAYFLYRGCGPPVDLALRATLEGLVALTE